MRPPAHIQGTNGAVGYVEFFTLRLLIRRETKHPPGHFHPAA